MWIPKFPTFSTSRDFTKKGGWRTKKKQALVSVVRNIIRVSWRRGEKKNLRRQFESLRRAATNCLLRIFFSYSHQKTISYSRRKREWVTKFRAQISCTVSHKFREGSWSEQKRKKKSEEYTSNPKTSKNKWLPQILQCPRHTAKPVSSDLAPPYFTRESVEFCSTAQYLGHEPAKKNTKRARRRVPIIASVTVCASLSRFTERD